MQYNLLQLFAASPFNPGWVVTLLLDALPSLAYLLWVWQVGLQLYHRLPEQIKIGSAYLHLGAVYLVLYTLLFIYTISLVKESVLDGNLPFGMLLLLVPMHLLATFCFLYSTYFAARSLVSIEQQRVVGFGEFAGAYFLFMLLPIGIWFLQPRLHKVSRGTGHA